MSEGETVKSLSFQKSLTPAFTLTLLTSPPVSYTHLRAHETVLDLVCRLLLEKKKQPSVNKTTN